MRSLLPRRPARPHGGRVSAGLAPRSASGRGGFTMVEVLVASALLGVSLVVMFGFHNQARRANASARRLTDCTWLAQTQMDRLLVIDWSTTATPTDLTNAGSVDAGAAGAYDPLEWPGSPVEVNAVNSTSGSESAPVMYTVTWDVEEMDTSATWIRLRVRCTYEESGLATLQGTTISSYRYRDN